MNNFFVSLLLLTGADARPYAPLPPPICGGGPHACPTGPGKTTAIRPCPLGSQGKHPHLTRIRYVYVENVPSQSALSLLNNTLLRNTVTVPFLLSAVGDIT